MNTHLHFTSDFRPTIATAENDARRRIVARSHVVETGCCARYHPQDCERDLGIVTPICVCLRISKDPVDEHSIVRHRRSAEHASLFPPVYLLAQPCVIAKATDGIVLRLPPSDHLTRERRQSCDVRASRLACAAFVVCTARPTSARSSTTWRHPLWRLRHQSLGLRGPRTGAFRARPTSETSRCFRSANLRQTAVRGPLTP